MAEAYQVTIKIENGVVDSETTVVKSKDEIIKILIHHISMTSGDSVRVLKGSEIVYG